MIRSSPRWVPWLLVWLFAIGVSPEAFAVEIVPISQERTISADLIELNRFWRPSSNPFFPDFAGPDHVIATTNGPLVVSADGFEGFDEVVAAADSSPLVVASSTADQQSEITHEFINATGSYAVSLAAEDEILTFGGPFNYLVLDTAAQPSTAFSTLFELEQDSTYHLVARIGREPSSPKEALFFPFFVDGRASVSLVGPGKTVVLDEAVPDFDCDPSCIVDDKQIDQKGTLPAGTYMLSAEATVDSRSTCLDINGGVMCFPLEGSGGFDLALTITVPEPRAISLQLAALAALAGWRGAGRAGFADHRSRSAAAEDDRAAREQEPPDDTTPVGDTQLRRCSHRDR